MKTSAMDTIGASAAKASILASSGTAAVSFFTQEILFGIVGLIFTLLTFLMSWYYKRKSNARAEAAERRREAEHRLRMELMRQKGHLLIDPVSEPTVMEDE